MAASLGLGTALAVLTLGFTVLVAILVGFDVPALLGRVGSDRDHHGQTQGVDA